MGYVFSSHLCEVSLYQYVNDRLRHIKCKTCAKIGKYGISIWNVPKCQWKLTYFCKLCHIWCVSLCQSAKLSLFCVCHFVRFRNEPFPAVLTTFQRVKGKVIRETCLNAVRRLKNSLKRDVTEIYVYLYAHICTYTRVYVRKYSHYI